MEYLKAKKLQDAGVLHEDHGFSNAQLKQLELLSDEEVGALVSIRKKLNKFSWPIGGVIRPQMF